MNRIQSFPKDEPPASEGAACRNCGARLAGRYCSDCGQKDAPLDPSVRQIMAEWLEEYVALDSRLARTLITLVRRPGWLTIDYNQGRRARYVPPLRLYMVVSVLFFFALALGPAVVHIQTDEEDRGAASAEPSGDSNEGASAETSGGAEAGAEVAESGGEAEAAARSSDRGFGAWLGARARLAQSDPAAFNRFWIRVFAWSMFALVPIAALFLGIAFRRPKRPYIHHLVFALHSHTFAFLVFVLAIAASILLPVEREAAARVLVPAAAVAGLVYFYLAMLRVYGEGALRTALKSFLLGSAYLVAQATFQVASLLVAFVLFSGREP